MKIRKPLFRPNLVQLESRDVPATIITILDSGAGTLDGFLSATDGTIAAADNAGVAGSVSRAALQGVNATTNISITAETSIVVNNLTSALGLQSGSSNSATFTASAGSLTFNDTTDSITTAGGSITLTTLTAALGGLSSSGGNITITADNVDLQATINAGTGIATLANSTVGRQIDLGTNTAGKIGITQSEIDLVTASVLRIGSTTSGNLNVSAPITRTVSPLTLISNATVTDAVAGNITANSLRVSSAGSVTLDSNNTVGTLAAATTAVGTASVFFSNGTNPLIVGVVDTVTGITTANGNVTLAANTLDVAQAINAAGAPATGGIVTLQPFTGIRDIDVGTEAGAATLNLTDTELDRITASVLRVGFTTNLDISVTAAITLDPTKVGALSLIAGNTITDTATGSIVAAALRASGTDGVTLDNAANNVAALAGSTTTAAADFVFVDADGFVVVTVDSVAGITTNLAATTGVTLTAGGAVTQAAGANVFTNELQLLGAGSYNLANLTNNSVTLAANLTTATTGTLLYTDADALTISTIVATVTTNGITANSDVTVTATNGNLTVVDNGGLVASSGNASLFLTAGSVSNDNTVIIAAGAQIVGAGGIILTADNLNLGAGSVVNSGAGTTTLRPFEAGTLINLGGADAANTLGITQTEINNVVAGTLLIGNSTSGTITVSTNITRSASTNVQLQSGAAILQPAGGGSINTNGGTLLVTPGTNYAPQRNGNDVTASTMSFTSGSDLAINIAGATVDTQYTQLNVAGAVNLTGVDLALSGAFVPTLGTVFTIVSATSRTGTFNGLPEGATLAFGGKTLQVQYTATTVQLVVNTPPTISDVGNQSAFVNTPIGPVAFTINDAETPLANLTVTAKSSNTTLFTNGIVLGGSGGNRTVTLTPASGQSGTTTITVTVADANGGTAIDTFNVTISTSSHNLAVGGPNQTASLFVPNASGTYGSPAATLAPFGAVAGSVRTATADVNNDGAEDTILVTGPGTPIRFAVVSGLNNTTLLIPVTAPFAGSEDFLGGGFVSAADLDGDGRAEIVITPDQGGGPRVTIFSLVGTTPTVRVNFFGIDDPNFRGGARSALGDVNKDGKPDLLVAAGFGGGPRVSLFEGTTLFTTRTKLRNDFFAFPEDAATLRNGIFAALGDISGDGFADLIFGGGPGGAPRVFILSGALLTSNSPNLFSQPVANFFVAGNANDRGGVRLAAKNADGDAKADLAVGSGEGTPANVRVYLGKNFTGSGEPSAFQDISVFGGVALTDGVFVG